MSEKGEKRAAGRVFFDRIAEMREQYIAFDMMNRKVEADGWTPDVRLDNLSLADFIPRDPAEGQASNKSHMELTDGWWEKARENHKNQWRGSI